MWRLNRAALALWLLAGPLAAADLFPLAPGNSWTYREMSTGQSFTITVGPPLQYKDQTYYRVRGYVGGDVMTRLDDDGHLVYLDPNGREGLLTPLAPSQDSWNVALRPCDLTAQALERRGIHEGPAGRFAGVLEVQYRGSCADAGTDVEQFAENIGMVRRTVESIAGPRQFDLIAARVGTMVIESRPHGTLSVTAAGIDGPNLDVILELDLGASELGLDFPTSQEYEVELQDATGTVFWRYSDGRAFTPAVHRLEIAGEWRAVVRIPSPAGSDWQPGDYRVLAWLTPYPGQPRFAATAPVRIVAR